MPSAGENNLRHVFTLVQRLPVISNILSGMLPAISTPRALLGIFPAEMQRLACRLIDRVIGMNGGRVVLDGGVSSNDEDSLRSSVQRHGATGYVCKGDLAGLRRSVRRFAGI